MAIRRRPCLKLTYPSGRVGKLPLYDSSKPRERNAVVYMVKTLPDGVRLAFNRDDKLIGSVRATPAEWDAAAIHSLDTWPGYSVKRECLRGASPGTAHARMRRTPPILWGFGSTSRTTPLTP